MSKLAQFWHQERYQAANIKPNVPQVRQSVDEIVCLLFPQRGCLGTKGPGDIKSVVKKLEEQFAQYFQAWRYIGAIF